MRRTAAASLSVLFLALLAAACDMPTGSPVIDSRWVLAGDETSIDVTELLPAGMAVSDDGRAFEAEVDDTNILRTLGDLCSPCEQVDGLIVPKPAFEHEYQDHSELPADVSTAELSAATVRITLENGFSFDPLRPGGAETGTLRVDLLTAASLDAPGRTVGSTTLDGSEDAFPPGGTVTRTVALEPGTVQKFLVVEVSVVSPDGDPVRIDADETLEVTAVTEELRASSAAVEVSDLEISGEPVDLDVGDVDPTVVERIRSGDFVLDSRNPWSAEADLTLVVSGPGFSTITKSVTVPGGSSTRRVSFTGEELRSFLGQPGVTLETEGVANATSGPVTVSPGQRLEVISDFDLTLRIGG